MESFFNYVDEFCPFLSTYLPPVEIGEGILLILHTRENVHTVDISSATYLPRIVKVIKERPLMPVMKNSGKGYKN